MNAAEREAFDHAPRPPRFTGKHRGRYFYKGQLWLGPSNLIGAGKPFRVIESELGIYPTREVVPGRRAA